MRFRYGADPEVFVRHRETLEFVSAYGMIEGTKWNPQRVRNGAVQVDGMALEFNVNPCGQMGLAFLSRAMSILSLLGEMIPAETEIVISPVARFDQEYLDSQPVDAKRLGCEPDYDAWSGSANSPPDVTAPFRTAAGHIHVGWWNKPIKDQHRVFVMASQAAQQLDFTVGLASVLLDNTEDARLRRTLYGKAGAFRPKPYGMEYRTLSNFWLKSPALYSIIARLTMQATELLNNGVFLPEKEAERTHRLVREAINKSNMDSAYSLLLHFSKRYEFMSTADVRWMLDEGQRNEGQ